MFYTLCQSLAIEEDYNYTKRINDYVAIQIVLKQPIVLNIYRRQIF